MRAIRLVARTMSTTTATAQPVPSAAAAELPPLQYRVTAECPTTKARVGVMTLRHSEVDTPVFMPVGTQVREFGILHIIILYDKHFIFCAGNS